MSVTRQQDNDMAFNRNWIGISAFMTLETASQRTPDSSRDSHKKRDLVVPHFHQAEGRSNI